MISCPNNCQGKTTPIFNNTLTRCETCSHVFANMNIGEEELRKVYSENYFKGEEYSDYLADKLMLQKNFNNRLKKIKKLNPPSTFEQVLEIGCAYGLFGDLIQQKFPAAHYTGYDVVPEAIEYAQNTLKLNAHCEDYLKTNCPQTYSDVFMWDVIEHLPQPELFIEKVSAETLTGGRIYITTGDIGKFIPRWRGKKWRMIHPPSHLHYFTRKSISKLLEKNGFKVESVSYPSVSRSIRLIFYSLFMLRRKPGSISRKIYNLIPEKASVSINTFDIMFVIAKKV